MKEREGLGKRLSRALELGELVDERDSLELRGISELTVREVGRFLHYSDTEIRLSLRQYVLRIGGKGLYCTSYLGGIVRVHGEISAIDIQKRQDKLR